MTLGNLSLQFLHKLYSCTYRYRKMVLLSIEQVFFCIFDFSNYNLILRYWPLNGQMGNRKSREPNKTTFPHTFRNWIKFQIMIPKKGNSGLFWVKIDPKCQRHIIGPREPNKTTFPLNLKTWKWIFIKKNRFRLFLVHFKPFK